MAPRLNDVVTADIKLVAHDDAVQAWFHIVGIGSRQGKMSVWAALLAKFKHYWQAFGLASVPLLDNRPLILMIRSEMARAADINAVRTSLRGTADGALDLDKQAVADLLLLTSTH